MFDIKKNLGWLLTLFLIGFAVYAFNLNNQLFWDDDDWIIGNPNVHSLSWTNIKTIFSTDILNGFGLNSNYYRPLLLLSFAFNWVLHGATPFGYHIVSNLFHIGNAVLIFLLLTTLKVVMPKTVDNSQFFSKRAAFIAALLWLVHPLHVEAVAYISGRGDPMSVFFILGGLFLFANGKRWWAVLAMVLAVFSRETAILFPALAMVLYISFQGPTLAKKGRTFLIEVKDAFVKTLPYWGISAFYMLLRLTVLNFQNTLNFYSQSNAYTENLSYRLYTFGHALVEYFSLMFWPLGLHMERELPVHTSLFQWPVWLGFLIVAGVLFIIFKKLNTNRIWLFCWGWFFVAISPVSGIIPINALLYEHWLYLPLIGLAALAGFYIDKIIRYKAVLITLVILVGFFSVLSIGRNLAWGNRITFYEDILKYNPNTVRIINNLGNAYAAEGELQKAAEMYERAIQLPDGQAFAQPYYNLANTYRDQNKPEEAAKMYAKAIEIDPSFPFAYKNLAVLYAKYGFFAEAIEVLEKLKEIRPEEGSVIDEAIRRLKEDASKK
ncbi:MAG: tetratricopeptide repeat protein [Candidatus Paceibacterota bacterium]